MREILFRGKRVENGEWVEGALIFYPISGKKEIYAESKTRFNLMQNYEIIPETIGQFTGLLDKNGTKIFEGDIIKSIFDSSNGFSKEILATVEYDKTNPSFVMTYKYEGDGFYCQEYDFVQCNLRTNEIMGNIHDNDWI